MKLAVTLAAVAALALSIGAQATDYIPWPSSTEPVFLPSGLIRFNTNLVSHDRAGESYVVEPDGTGLRPATPAEAAESPAASPAGEALSFPNGLFPPGPLWLADAHGRHRVLQSHVYRSGDAALSPNGKTYVFAEWVGWVYSDGAQLYAAPVDGSTQPVRLTPDPCTLHSTTNSSLRGRCLDGSDGPDRIVGTPGGDIVIAGSGNDTIDAGGGQNEIQAQWGNDTVRTGAGPDTIDLGPGKDTVFSGAGSDQVIANDGQRDVIDCGAGYDYAFVDRSDVTRNCERVVFRPISP
jgi:hypothetical protein